jgi:hypothetical protein
MGAAGTQAVLRLLSFWPNVLAAVGGRLCFSPIGDVLLLLWGILHANPV